MPCGTVKFSPTSSGESLCAFQCCLDNSLSFPPTLSRSRSLSSQTQTLTHSPSSTGLPIGCAVLPPVPRAAQCLWAAHTETSFISRNKTKQQKNITLHIIYIINTLKKIPESGILTDCLVVYCHHVQKHILP